jgi:hypothetical protein
VKIENHVLDCAPMLEGSPIDLAGVEWSIWAVQHENSLDAPKRASAKRRRAIRRGGVGMREIVRPNAGKLALVGVRAASDHLDDRGGE